MPMNRREFLAASAASAAMLNHEMTAFAAATGNIQVTIDASKSGTPVNPGFPERAERDSTRKARF